MSEHSRSRLGSAVSVVPRSWRRARPRPGVGQRRKRLRLLTAARGGASEWPPMRFDHRLPLLFAALAAALVAGCKTAPSSSTTAQPASIAANQAPPPNAATKAAATKGNLAIEKVRL